MSIQPRRRMAVAVCLLALAGCGGNVVIPGLVAPGGNRPPVIANAKLERTASGLLKISATVFDPDANGITVTYEQRSGPFASQQSALLVGGAYSALLNAAGDGDYAFRLHASDGFFDAAADVNLSVGNTSDAGARAAPVGLPLPSGQFKVRLNGQTIADQGLASFALDATLVLSPPPPGYAGANGAVVSLKTNASPLAGAAPAGSVAIDSAGALSGGIVVAQPSGKHLLIRTDAQSGPLNDLLDLSVQSGDIVLTGPSDAANRAGISVAQFRPAAARSDALDAGSVLVTLRLMGDTVTGVAYLSTSAASAANLPRFAEYSAQISGTRTR